MSGLVLPQPVDDRWLDAISEAVLVIEPSGCIRFANRAAEQLLARPFEQLQGMPLVCVWPGASRLPQPRQGRPRAVETEAVLRARGAVLPPRRACVIDSGDGVRLVRFAAALPGAEPPLSRVQAGPIVVDLQGRRVTREGSPVELTRTEFLLLAELARRRGLVVTSEDLVAAVWGPEDAANTALVRNVVWRLRRKLEPDPAKPRSPVTVPNLGYVFGPVG